MYRNTKKKKLARNKINVIMSSVYSKISRHVKKQKNITPKKKKINQSKLTSK